jgi:hypothetical protein
VRFLGEWYTPVQQKPIERIKTAERMKVRGTSQSPGAPRDVFVQSGPRGVLANWRAPAQAGDVAGWRIYKGDETLLFAEIHEPSTTQHFIETTAGATPPIENIFVSAINKLGVESTIVQAQGKALTEAGAPNMPNTPPTYSTPYTPSAKRPSGL